MAHRRTVEGLLLPARLAFFFFWFFETGFHFVDQAGLELRNPPASAYRVLGLKACTTTPGMALCIFFFF
jgi:hypothetical protein